MNHCWLLSEDIIWRSAMFNHDAISINAWSHNFFSPLSQFRTCKHDNLSTKTWTQPMFCVHGFTENDLIQILPTLSL